MTRATLGQALLAIGALLAVAVGYLQMAGLL